ncbi:MAG: sialate O-acetylesterase [Bacteroidota bacterium]|nr:sialate O-acetylesterase [Bacteroidota bacterium]
MKTIQKFSLLLAILILAGHQIILAQVHLPLIFNDNMILQRDKPVNVWGWASKGEKITVSFNGQELSTRADAQGNWRVVLKPMTFGGPFEMSVRGKLGSKVFKNVLIGDVWVCSGQSNMEFPVNGWTHVLNHEKEIASANYPNIRLFSVEKNTSHQAQKDFKGGNWQVCSPATISPFSAVGYFFGRKLNIDLKIPIGLINTTWGGTNIETWTSWESISKREEYKNMNPAEFLAKEATWAKNKEKFQEALKHDPGIDEKWFAPETNAASWSNVELPHNFEHCVVGDLDGIVWFRKDIELTGNQAEKAILLSLGAIDDYDETYVNGVLVGKTDDWALQRKYALTPGLLKSGKNTIVVKVLDRAGGGGFSSSAADMFLSLGATQISLAGEWKFKPAVTSIQYDFKDAGPNVFPSQLYNAMVAPMIQFPIKGVIWYQGEQNAGEPKSYYTLFPEMIQNWRNKWGYEFPFLWVQLANFMAPSEQPVESSWAELREAQHQTLKVPKTGEAVIIDLGEAYDIHPKNKQDVGYRLALSALKNAYEKDVVYSGPVFRSMEIKDGKAVLEFDNPGNGLIAKGDKYGYLKGFAISGKDKHFVWAKAYIDGDKVVVYSDDVKEPTAVRYAWGDNPDDANLFNSSGLPASPFRTDITAQGK